LAKGVFAHRANSIYDDFPEEQYQFGQQLLEAAKRVQGDWIVYYESRRGSGRSGYFAIAQVADVVDDPAEEGKFLALIEPGSYLPFENFVPFRTENGFLESSLEKPDGSVNRGKMGWSIRTMPDQEFHRILGRGFSSDIDILPRTDIGETGQPGFQDAPEPFVFDYERERVEATTNRLVRNRVFRRLVLDAYDRRCAFTGLQLINGGGRAEVEAAHIKGVAEKGPDTIRNGIALSGTVHWMFDRGLLSLTDEYEIMISRQINNREQIEKLLHPSGRAIVPENPKDRPHPKYLNWHRQGFKH